MVKLWLGLILVTIACSYAQGACNYDGFLTCLNDTILNEWSELEKDGKAKLDSDRNKAIKCLRTVSCTKQCEPKEQFEDEIEDTEIKRLVVSIKTVWDKWPRTMQACVLENVRDKFFKELETRVSTTVPGFKLPEKLGPLPMPPPSLYEKNDRYDLKRYVGDKIGALLCLQTCSSYDDKKKVVKCMKKEIDGPLGKCVSSRLCAVSECKQKFPSTCDAVSKAIQQIVTDKGVKLSSFDDGDKSRMLSELKTCKVRAVAEEGILESSFYKPLELLTIFREFTHVAASNKADQFKLLIKDLFNSYFDADSFCTAQDC